MLQDEKSSTTSPLTESLQKFLDHWAWECYTYIFAALFGVLALSCLLVVVQQCIRPKPNKRNNHGRFTTAILFLAATLKTVALVWSPISMSNASIGTFIASLLMDCFSMALTLSAFSILLLILLETTKTSLAAPWLQNIWVLLGITAFLSSIMLTFNLLVLYSDRAFWYFASYVAIFIWGILICAGYTIAGYRMWRNLKSSRQLGHSIRGGRLKNIIILVFLSPTISAVSLILSICMAASDYGILVELEINSTTMWTRYTLTFLMRACEYIISVLIFGTVIQTKSRSNSVGVTSTVQMGTFVEDKTTKTTKYQPGDEEIESLKQ